MSTMNSKLVLKAIGSAVLGGTAGAGIGYYGSMHGG